MDALDLQSNHYIKTVSSWYCYTEKDFQFADRNVVHIHQIASDLWRSIVCGLVEERSLLLMAPNLPQQVAASGSLIQTSFECEKIVKQLEDALARQLNNIQVTSSSIAGDQCNTLFYPRDEEIYALEVIRRVVRSSTAMPRTPEQLEAIIMISKRDTDVIYVDRTGAGKSIVCQATSILHPALSIVLIVPTVALSTDQVARCQDIDLNVIAYSKEMVIQPASAPHVIVAIWEHIDTKEFQTMLKELEATKLLNCIVLDEAHAILEDEYRSSRFDNMLHCSCSVPILCMTATLECGYERKLAKFLRLGIGFKIIRGATVRRDYVLSVHTVIDQSSLLPKVTSLGKEFWEKQKGFDEWAAEQRVIVYVLTIYESDMLAQHLQDYSIPA